MSMIHEQAAFLLDFAALIQEASNRGFIVTAGELLRPREMQEIYVKQGKSKTLLSLHMEKLAGDLNFFTKEGKYIIDIDLLAPLGHFWESLDPKNRWGGNFDKDWGKVDRFLDAPHFERKIN